jgi:hypothetical protein
VNPAGDSAGERIATLDHAEQHADDRDHEEDVDETSHGVGGDDAEQPEDDEDDDEC